MASVRPSRTTRIVPACSTTNSRLRVARAATSRRRASRSCPIAREPDTAAPGRRRGRGAGRGGRSSARPTRSPRRPGGSPCRRHPIRSPPPSPPPPPARSRRAPASSWAEDARGAAALRRLGVEPLAAVGSRRRDPYRRRHALRHAAARGRLDARARRGRRRRSVRAQVPRRRAGPEGARGGDRGGRARPRRSGCRCPRSCSWSSTRQLGRAEPDPEIQELIAAAAAATSALDFLPGSLTYTRPPARRPTRELAAAIVWLDALTTNVDRTPQNPNLLIWHGRLWLIDHGAALYRQHAWEDPPAEARRPFPPIRAHVLLPCGGSIAEADVRLAPLLDPRLRRGDPRRGARGVARAGVARRLRRVPVPPARGAAGVRP